LIKHNEASLATSSYLPSVDWGLADSKLSQKSFWSTIIWSIFQPIHAFNTWSDSGHSKWTMLAKNQKFSQKDIV